MVVATSISSQLEHSPIKSSLLNLTFLPQNTQINTMAACLKPPRLSSTEDDSLILFSTSNSPEESNSPSSSFYHSPPTSLHQFRTANKLSVRNLSYTLLPHKTTPLSYTSPSHKWNLTITTLSHR